MPNPKIMSNISKQFAHSYKEVLKDVGGKAGLFGIGRNPFQLDQIVNMQLGPSVLMNYRFRNHK